MVSYEDKPENPCFQICLQYSAACRFPNCESDTKNPQKHTSLTLPLQIGQCSILYTLKRHPCQHTSSQEVNTGGLQPVIPPWDECKHVPPTTFPLQLCLSQVLLWTVALY